MSDRHRKEINDYWSRRGPSRVAEPRPTASFIRPHLSAGAEMGKAIKALPRRPQAPATVPLPGSPVMTKRAEITTRFAERADSTAENRLRAAGITDRHDGALQLKRWQRQEVDAIGVRMREDIDRLREERDRQREDHDKDWADHKAKHDKLRDEARRALGMTEPEVEAQEAEPWPTDRYGNEVIDMSGPVEPEEPPALKPDSFVPERCYPDMDFEIGD